MTKYGEKLFLHTALYICTFWTKLYLFFILIGVKRITGQEDVLKGLTAYSRDCLDNSSCSDKLLILGMFISVSDFETRYRIALNYVMDGP